VVVVAVTLVSGGDYFHRFWKHVVRGPSRTDPGNGEAGAGPSK
jgi:hypothetical protein